MFAAHPGPRFASLLLLAVVAAGCGDDDDGVGGAGGSGAGGAAGGGGDAPDCEVERRAEDDAVAPPIHTPRWAFRPWISKDISTGEDTRAFLQGFVDRDIPVGVVVLDSPWETQYNTFVANPDRYPDFAGMVSDFRDQDVRVVLWTTQMINYSSYDLESSGDVYLEPSPDYDPAVQCGYFINDGESFNWWKGAGGAIDFFDPDARAFWHRLQDPLFDMGVAGFKLDFGENYIDADIVSEEGPKTLQEYSEAYYEDFYAYGNARAEPDEFVTMVRPYDKSYQFEGRFFARPEHAPVAWVGDNRRDYIGMKDALDHIFRSALEGYVVVGSDLGGYLDRDDVDLMDLVPLERNTFMRWTAMSAMTPFMQIHSRGNLEPWTFPEDPETVTDTYRYWSKLHNELVPFFDSVAIAQYGGADIRMIEPVAAEADWETDWRYWLGGALLVAPITDDTGTLDLEIPDDGEYYDLFDPDAVAVPAGTVLTALDVSDATRIPVFAREGAIIPMEVGDDVTGFGNENSEECLTVLVYPAAESSSFDVYANDDSIEVTITAETTEMSADVEVSEHTRPVILRVRHPADAATVELAGVDLVAHATRGDFDVNDSGWFQEGGFVWVKLSADQAGAVHVE